MKRICSLLLALALTAACISAPVSAAGYPEGGAAIARASGRLDYSFPSGVSTIGSSFSLVSGDVISYDCTYTPASASVDFGYIGPDGKFHYLNCTTGSINEGFRVGQSGLYQLAIRNNESYSVAITGTVTY